MDMLVARSLNVFLCLVAARNGMRSKKSASYSRCDGSVNCRLYHIGNETFLIAPEVNVIIDYPFKRTFALEPVNGFI